MPTVSLSCPPSPRHARRPPRHARRPSVMPAVPLVIPAGFKRESRNQTFVLCYDLPYGLTVPPVIPAVFPDNKCRGQA